MRLTSTILVLSLAGGVAHADKQAAEACRAALSPVAQEVYNATIAQSPTKATAAGIVKAEVEKLMSEGKLSMSDARKEGEAAGACLKDLE